MLRKIVVLAGLLLVLSLSVSAATAQDLDIDTAWQPFERGVMLWFRETDQIWVLLGSNNNTLAGTVIVYADSWQEGMGNPSVSAPQGKYVPQRGFGLAWQALQGGGGAPGPIGWALAPELGYDSTGMSVSGSEYLIDGPGNTVYAVNPSNSTWRTVTIG